MKNVTLPSGKTVSVPSTTREWQLYTDMKGCSRAATALTAALVRVLKKLDPQVSKGYAPNSEALDGLWDKLFRPVQSKYAEFGASDTEPRHVAFGAMEKFVKDTTGVSVQLW